ncbi:hypothetical protein Y032_0396g665 [Ancylostoma ceylanicum]|uniref:Uncharacterized protein n=1 Tax=Ancylostoma ceylanicum TaxID=53326 RepID=A0A016RRH0_9BILA|nr:hypothetical protein Y032_0396g665 [Ancylostoma ceylanicum]
MLCDAQQSRSTNSTYQEQWTVPEYERMPLPFGSFSARGGWWVEGRRELLSISTPHRKGNTRFPDHIKTSEYTTKSTKGVIEPQEKNSNVLWVFTNRSLTSIFVRQFKGYNSRRERLTYQTKGRIYERITEQHQVSKPTLTLTIVGFLGYLSTNPSQSVKNFSGVVRLNKAQFFILNI